MKLDPRLEALKNNSKSLQSVKGTIRAIQDDVIVQNMNFGERKTESGLILTSDDGKDHGIRPRWAKVHAIGPKQTNVAVGDWILIEHGRWSRSWKMLKDDVETELWKADPECILGTWTGEGDPQDTGFGQYTGAGDTAKVKPEDFGAGR